MNDFRVIVIKSLMENIVGKKCILEQINLCETLIIHISFCFEINNNDFKIDYYPTEKKRLYIRKKWNNYCYKECFTDSIRERLINKILKKLKKELC